jgi:PleD family two-component response regulator
MSIIALAIDRFEAYRAQSEDAAARIMAHVAAAVRGTAADIGAIAAVYRSGTIVIIAPDAPLKKAVALGESLRSAVARLPVFNPESVAKGHVTASLSVVTGRPGTWSDGAHLLMRALSAVPHVSAAGGNRVVPAYL